MENIFDLQSDLGCCTADTAFWLCTSELLSARIKLIFSLCLISIFESVHIWDGWNWSRELWVSAERLPEPWRLQQQQHKLQLQINTLPRAGDSVHRLSVVPRGGASSWHYYTGRWSFFSSSSFSLSLPSSPTTYFMAPEGGVYSAPIHSVVLKAELLPAWLIKTD